MIADHGPKLTHGVLDQHMPYADAVIREVLRVTPPSNQVMRKTMVDMQVRRLSRMFMCMYAASHC